MFTYSRKSFPADQKFLVVHQTEKGKMTTAVHGCPDLGTAEQDVAEKMAKVKRLDLKCSYVVQKREDGTPV